jgi:hypothetical protein
MKNTEKNLSLLLRISCIASIATAVTLKQTPLVVAQSLATSHIMFPNRTLDSAQHRDLATQTLNEDNECFEDRLEAIEVGRQCSRRCRKDVPCENARKQCLCDGLCGMSCLKPDLNCPELPKIEHGDYEPKSTRLNTRVTYQCEPGYYLFGSRERLCQGDEDWSGTPAECLIERE